MSTKSYEDNRANLVCLAFLFLKTTCCGAQVDLEFEILLPLPQVLKLQVHDTMPGTGE
jgi:hypothetical protein